MAEKKSSASRKKDSSSKKSPASSREPNVSLWELKKEIDVRAHQIYLDRIASHESGDELSDWLLAETEIKKKHNLS